MRIITGLSRYSLLIATLYLAFPSIACANEGPLWLYLAISPLIIFQQIPFLGPALLVILAIVLCLRLKARSLALTIAGLLCLMAAVAGYHENERRKLERHESEIQQQRIEANRARYKAMREGKPVAPLDEKALVAEAQSHMKSSGDAEKDRLNQQAAEDLVHMKVAIDAMMAGQQPPPPPKREPRTADVDQMDTCSKWQVGKQASQLVAEARKLHPEYAQLSPGQAHAKGLEHYRRQEFASSIWAWECEALKNPQAKDGVNDIGIAYMELNNPPRSLEYARKALNIDRNFAHAHHTAGRALLSMGRYSSARTSAAAAITGGWEPWWSYEVLGLALRGMHDVAGGNEALRKAVAAQPGIPEIKWYADGNSFETTWPDCWNEKKIATSPKINNDPPVKQPETRSKHLAPELGIWGEVKDKLPAGFEGRTMKELESAAGQRFGNNDSPAAAALWLKAAEAADNNQDKARCWSMAARAHGKMVDEVMQIAVGPRPQHRLSRELAEKALSMKPDDEDVVYTAALLQYKTVDFIKAADTLKTADQRIRLGLPSLHLMEVVCSLANDYKSQRDAALRIGYDPDKTVAGWKPYDWDMWHAKCTPSEMARRMRANGSSIVTGESIIGGIFLFLMVAFSACCGWFAGKLFSAKAASGWLHFAVVLCLGTGVVAIVALLESFAGRIFNLAIAPWFYLVMTLPLTAICAYVFGVLARSFVKREA